MSAACERLRSRRAAYDADALPREERAALREHLRGCSVCRAEAAAADPVLLFSALPEERVESSEVASVVSSVRAAIAWKEAERRVESPSRRAKGLGRRRAVRVAAAAAVFLCTLAVPSSLRSPAAPERARRAEAPPAGIPGVAPRAGAAKASSGATVYDWNPGAGEPRVVWIVDGSLDI